MGAERACTVKLGRRAVTGKAHLESTEIRFRGDDLRLVIPLGDISAVTERQGALSIHFAGRRATFHLGPDAGRWAEKIRHPKSRIDKLGVKPDQVVWVISVRDARFLAELQARTSSVSSGKPTKNADAIFLGASTLSDLERIAELVACIKPNGAIWTLTPKGKGGIKDTDVIAAGRAAGLVDVKVVSLSDTHSANKFVIPRAKR
jgi:hypothetical protein